MYDNEDSVCGIIRNNVPYYFKKNLQGDIIAIVDKDAKEVARYSYDAWGACTVVSASNVIGYANPFRYRGYYYDLENKLYYLNSRYYDPAVGRFLNVDEFGFLESHYNLFNYCNNSPTIEVDPFGNGPAGAIIGAILGFGLGLIIVPYVADLLRLTGWARNIFIWAGTAAITSLGAYVGYYVGEAIFKIYKSAGRLALKVNEAIARGIAKLIGSSLEPADGNGWKLKVGKLILRVMTEGGGRVNYFRLSHLTKGSMTVGGQFSNDRGVTHIEITLANIIQLVSTILKNK